MNATGSIVRALVTLCAIHSAFGFLEPGSLLTRPSSSLRPSSVSSFAKAGNLRPPVDHEAKHQSKAQGVRSLSATIPSACYGASKVLNFAGHGVQTERAKCFQEHAKRFIQEMGISTTA